MAAKFTHIEALKQSVELLEHGDDEQQDIADRLHDRQLFRFACLGAIAPDVFYFYHIFSPGKNARGLAWGNRAHHSRVFDLALNFMDQLREAPADSERDRQFAFVMGYLCHCAVDIVTHPYIFYITGNPYSEDPDDSWEAQSHHLRVEFALDSYVIHKRWGMTPREYNFMKYLRHTDEVDENNRRVLDRDVWRLWVRGLERTFPEDFEQDYPGSSREVRKGDLINEAYLGFLRFSSVTDVRSRVIRFLLYLVDWLTFRKLRIRYLILPKPKRIDPRLPNEAGAEWKFPAEPGRVSNESFMELLHRAARFSAKLMTDGRAYIDGDMKRSEFEKIYRGYNLDTGVRSDSLDMQAFDPIHDEQ
ncbi:MAG: zinc dependent phospholipase C family protein [bacterium]|nr:zinc dependent phospholipase C family protein [bacterium]